ncbi:MAG: hypothetical protein ACH37Z_12365, partial [Anaerolineae bacterium]
EGWVCPHCDELAFYALQPEVCPRCDNIAPFKRSGFVVESLCRCHLAQADLANKERVRQIDDERDRKQQFQSDERRDSRDSAARCWRESGEACTFPKNRLPWPYCGSCKRFDPKPRKD